MHWRGCGRRHAQPVLQRAAKVGTVQRNARQGSIGQGECGAGCRVTKQQLGLRVGHHAAQCRSTGPRRQRCHDHAGAQRAQEDRGIGHGIGGTDRDGVAGLQPVALQGGGDAVHQRVQCAVAEALAGVGQGQVVRGLLRVLTHQVGDQAKVLFQQVVHGVMIKRVFALKPVGAVACAMPAYGGAWSQCRGR